MKVKHHSVEIDVSPPVTVTEPEHAPHMAGVKARQDQDRQLLSHQVVRQQLIDMMKVKHHSVEIDVRMHAIAMVLELALVMVGVKEDPGTSDSNKNSLVWLINRIKSKKKKVNYSKTVNDRES